MRASRNRDLVGKLLHKEMKKDDLVSLGHSISIFLMLPSRGTMKRTGLKIESKTERYEVMHALDQSRKESRPVSPQGTNEKKERNE
jgi:hypothetical protein